MAIGWGPSLELISIILFLLPGFAGIKLGLRIAERGDWFNRLETTALSFALSMASMLYLYIAGSAYKSVLLGDVRLLSRADVAQWNSTIPSAILSYLLLLFVSLVGGLLLGEFDFGGKYFSPNLPWAKFHHLAEKSGSGETYIVRVRTMAGDELRGTVEDEGEAARNKDIILENPMRLRFDEGGEITDDRSWTGNAYIHSQSIAHVEFDRLEDADAIEAEDYERKEEKTLQDTSEREEQEEMAELEELAEGAEEAGEEMEEG